MKGNLPLDIRYRTLNPDGSVSTVRTMSINDGKGEVLIPTVIKGKVRSDKESIQHYHQTGENFGTFDTVKQADAYAQQLHKSHESQLRNERKNPVTPLQLPAIMPYTSNRQSDPAIGGGLVTRSPSILDSIVYALTGNSDDALTPEQKKSKDKKRKEAGDLAAEAADNPGEAFMGIPSGGGSGFNLGNIISTLGKML